MHEELLRAEKVSCHFGSHQALREVSLTIRKGEVLGLVGESGSGKTTFGRCIMGLYPLSGGTIYYENTPLSQGKRRVQSDIQMIFQDPMASLDPRMTVRQSVAEGLVIRGIRDRETLHQRVDEMLELVGLRPEYAERYPHEFSGGQRQRIGIARALVMEPRLLIADEPVSALDVSVQAQVINLLEDLQNKLDLTVLFIAHDLSVVRHFCHRIGVLHLGQLLELAPTEQLFAGPLHPYTRSLLSAMPVPDPRLQRQRRRIPYTPLQPAQRDWLEVAPEHFLLCSPEERANW